MILVKKKITSAWNYNVCQISCSGIYQLVSLKILFSELFICFCKKMFLQMGIFVLTEHFELKYKTFTKHDGLNLNPVLKPFQRKMYVPMSATTR